MKESYIKKVLAMGGTRLNFQCTNINYNCEVEQIIEFKNRIIVVFYEHDVKYSVEFKKMFNGNITKVYVISKPMAITICFEIDYGKTISAFIDRIRLILKNKADNEEIVVGNGIIASLRNQNGIVSGYLYVHEEDAIYNIRNDVMSLYRDGYKKSINYNGKELICLEYDGKICYEEREYHRLNKTSMKKEQIGIYDAELFEDE